MSMFKGDVFSMDFNKATDSIIECKFFGTTGFSSRGRQVGIYKTVYGDIYLDSISVDKFNVFIPLSILNAIDMYSETDLVFTCTTSNSFKVIASEYGQSYPVKLSLRNLNNKLSFVEERLITVANGSANLVSTNMLSSNGVVEDLDSLSSLLEIISIYRNTFCFGFLR